MSRRPDRPAAYLWKKCPDPPEFWLREFPCTWICEWRFFSSFFVFKTGYDFDGLLCRDCRPDEDDDGPKYLNFIRTAEPLNVPRPQQIPLIATARREAYRAETLQWLARHGASVDRLVMGQWSSLRDRTAEKVVEMKAEAFRDDSRLTFFAESDPWQAEEIARLVPAKPVVCPPTGRIWNADKLTEGDGDPNVKHR